MRLVTEAGVELSERERNVLAGKAFYAVQQEVNLIGELDWETGTVHGAAQKERTLDVLFREVMRLVGLEHWVEDDE